MHLPLELRLRLGSKSSSSGFTPIPTLATGTPYRVYSSKKLVPGYSGGLFRLYNPTSTPTTFVVYAANNSNDIDISTIATWLNGATYADIDAVYEQLGSGDTVTQTNAANRFIFTLTYNLSGAPIGFKVDRAIKSNPYMNIPITTTGSLQSTTLVVAHANQCTNSGGTIQLGTGGVANTAINMWCGFGENNRGLYTFNTGGAFNATFRGRTQPSTQAISCGASSVRSYMDANLQSDAPSAAGTWAGGTIGRNGNSNYFYQGEFYAAIIYSTQVSDADMTTLRTYLNSQFGVKTSFPAHIIWAGTSLDQGTGCTFNQDTTRQLLPLLTKEVAMSNQGVYGDSAAAAHASFPSIYAPEITGSFAATRIFKLRDPSNDLNARASGTIVGFGQTLYDSYTKPDASAATALGAIALVNTMVARSWDGSATDISQKQTEYLDYNARVMADATGIGYRKLDFAARSELSNPLDTTYFNVDQVHLTNLGYLIRAQVAAPIINALI